MTKKKLIIIKREFDRSDAAIRNNMELISIDRRYLMHIIMTLSDGSAHHVWMEYKTWLQEYLALKAQQYGGLPTEPELSV